MAEVFLIDADYGKHRNFVAQKSCKNYKVLGRERNMMPQQIIYRCYKLKNYTSDLL